MHTWLLFLVSLSIMYKLPRGLRVGFGTSALGWRSTKPVHRRAHQRVQALHSSTSHNPYDHLDTIFALSSGPITKSGVAVVRISGPSSHYCLENLTIKSEVVHVPAQFKPREATLKALYSPSTKEVLDKSLVLWFPGPRSFTGEDVVELHVHGSRAVIKGVFEALEHLDDPPNGRAIRPAAPGEFTRRAFDNGKMDLTEVEGLGDLLDAETSAQRKQALKQMEGHLRRQYEAWRYITVHKITSLFNWN